MLLWTLESSWEVLSASFCGGFAVLVKEEGFPAADREGCRAEFVKNTNEEACCLSVRPDVTSSPLHSKWFQNKPLKFCSTGSSVYYSWSPVGGSVSSKRAILLKYLATFIVES